MDNMDNVDMVRLVHDTFEFLKGQNSQNYATLNSQVATLDSKGSEKIVTYRSDCRDNLASYATDELLKSAGNSLKCITARGKQTSYLNWISTAKRKSAIKILVKNTIERSMETYLNKKIKLHSKNYRIQHSTISFDGNLVNNSVDFYLLLGQTRWIIAFLSVLYTLINLKYREVVIDSFVEEFLDEGKLLNNIVNRLVDTFKSEKSGWACGVRGSYSEVEVQINESTGLLIKPKIKGPVQAIIQPHSTICDTVIYEFKNIFYLYARFSLSSLYKTRKDKTRYLFELPACKEIQRSCGYYSSNRDNIYYAINARSSMMVNDNANDKELDYVERMSKLGWDVISRSIIKVLGAKKLLSFIKETKIKDVLKADRRCGYAQLCLPSYFANIVTNDPKEIVTMLINVYFNIIENMKSVFMLNTDVSNVPSKTADIAYDLFLKSLVELYTYTDITPIAYDTNKSLMDNMLTQWLKTIDLCKKLGLNIFVMGSVLETYNLNSGYNFLHLKPKSPRIPNHHKQKYAAYQQFHPVVNIMDQFFKKIILEHEVKELSCPTTTNFTTKVKTKPIVINKLAAKSRACHARKRTS